MFPIFPQKLEGFLSFIQKKTKQKKIKNVEKIDGWSFHNVKRPIIKKFVRSLFSLKLENYKRGMMA